MWARSWSSSLGGAEGEAGTVPPVAVVFIRKILGLPKWRRDGGNSRDVHIVALVLVDRLG